MSGSHLKLKSSSLRFWSPNTGILSRLLDPLPAERVSLGRLGVLLATALCEWTLFLMIVLASTSLTFVCTLASHHPKSVCELMLLVRVLLSLSVTPVPGCMAFSSVIIVLALAVCFRACSTLTKPSAGKHLLGDRCIQQRIQVCHVEILNRSRAIRRRWVKQTL